MTTRTPTDQDPLERRTRAELAVLGREYLLAGHLQDRATMPQLIAREGAEAMAQVAIDEWMGASPVYTRRMQRALAFEGDDVPTIFKGLQFDIGAPHQFMDFRYRVEDPHHGEFWLDCCGALMDVEPMGESFVVAMCHDIEDPTFDATAVATNPRARMRPVHRPPRVPADREPHCSWKVFIDPDADPLTETDACREVARSRAAGLHLRRREVEGDWIEPGGWDDYSGPFDPDFQLEDLSHAALLTALDEFCLQGHLLVRSLHLALESRFDEEVVEEVVRAQFRGVAPVVAERIRAVARVEGDGPEALAGVLALHPAFRPRSYVSTRVTVEDGRVRFALRPSPVHEEGDRRSWPVRLTEDPTDLEPLAQAVNPRVRLREVAPRDDEVAAVEFVIDDTAEPASPPDEVTLTRFSTGTDHVFIRRRPVRGS